MSVLVDDTDSTGKDDPGRESGHRVGNWSYWSQTTRRGTKYIE